MIEALADLKGRVVYFPVRHHSPACARRVREVIELMKPAAVLIEGPSDFNDRIAELFLPHRLPIAIYSYAAWRRQPARDRSPHLRMLAGVAGVAGRPRR